MNRISQFFVRIRGKQFFRKLKKLFTCVLIIFFAVYVACNIVIYCSSKGFLYVDQATTPASYVALVPGASVYANGQPSEILADRLDKAFELYEAGKVKRFLLSGDHSTRTYNEVKAMKNYLNKKGVPDSVLFTDHAGLDTYSSMVRAARVFEVDSLIVVTQTFHLRRAVYIARKLGLTAYGYRADVHRYPSINYLMIRESFAGIKAVFEVLFHVNPRFGGEKIPITGDSSKSYD